MVHERKEYLTFLPVHNEQMAKLLKNEASWKIMKEVRKAGLKGITVSALEKKTHEAKTTIYSIIMKLESIGFIHGVKKREFKRKWGRPKKEDDWKEKKNKRTTGKSPKIYFECCELRTGMASRRMGEYDNPWGDVTFEEKFLRNMRNIIEKNKKTDKIYEILSKCLEDIYQEIEESDNKSVRSLMPNMEDNMCPDCKINHEGYEFLKALIFLMSSGFLDSEKFKDLLFKLKFKENKK